MSGETAPPVLKGPYTYPSSHLTTSEDHDWTSNYELSGDYNGTTLFGMHNQSLEILRMSLYLSLYTKLTVFECQYLILRVLQYFLCLFVFLGDEQQQSY